MDVMQAAKAARARDCLLPDEILLPASTCPAFACAGTWSPSCHLHVCVCVCVCVCVEMVQGCALVLNKG